MRLQQCLVAVRRKVEDVTCRQADPCVPSSDHGQQRGNPHFGDAGLVLARGIAAALLARERTGRGTTVDLLLLGMAMCSMAAGIAVSMDAGEVTPSLPRAPRFTPLAGTYRTADGRWIVLGLLVAAPVDVPDEIARRFPGAAIPSGRAG